MKLTASRGAPLRSAVAIITSSVIGVAALAAAEPAPGDETIAFTRRSGREAQLAFEARLNEIASPEHLAEWHQLLGSEPHIAGTPGDRRQVDRLAQAFEEMGLDDVEVQELWVYLPRPRDASIEIVEPERVELSVRESMLDVDPDTAHPELTIGWNAYSASGDVTAEVVYVNYGTKDDFELLADLGVIVQGKIALARYGGNYRGYKAKFAEEAGAMGLIIFSDPADAGRGPMYPEGGWATPESIQRGSIITIPYRGDPLTPFVPATLNAERLDPDDVALPRIPVQPIGWAAAREILGRMTGEAAPEPWRGGLDLEYRLTGGDDLRVRLAVDQERAIRPVWNVVATLEGSRDPEWFVTIGSHHDAWGFGAADPLAGTIVTMEVARCFAEAAREGMRPARSIRFGCWAAEEHGIIGSSEWVESRREQLERYGVAYLNLDMAAMGPLFSPAAAPTLKPLIFDAARYIAQPAIARDSEARVESVYDEWLRRSGAAAAATEPSIGPLGGGSDHVGFYCHTGVPSIGMAAGGSQGTSYHSNYDTLRWYRQVVGAEYESPVMLTRLTNIMVARLANADVAPLDPRRYAIDAARWLDEIVDDAVDEGLIEATERDSMEELRSLEATIAAAGDEAQSFMSLLLAATDGVGENGARALPPARLNAIGSQLIRLERDWLSEHGLPERPWYRSLYAAPDENSGYAAWTLPLLRRAVERGDREALLQAMAKYERVFQSLEARLAGMIKLLN